MEGSHNFYLVGLSYIIAVAASYTALELSRRVSMTEDREAMVWLAAGSCSMGIGVWTMHFVGMLAFNMPVRFSYDIPITILSLVVAIAVAAFAIFVASRSSSSYPKLALSGLLLGSGIAAMHYTGMAAMRMDATISYDMKILALSIVIAVVAACAALWIMFTLTATTSRHLGKIKLGAGMIMGVAICGMHYTGMAAAIYTPTGETMYGTEAVDNTWLAITIGGMALMILGFTHLTSFFDRRLRLEQEHSQMAEQEAVQLSEILDESSNEIFIFDSESHRFVKANRGATDNLGYSLEELRDMTPLDIMPDFTVKTFNELLRPLRDGVKNELLFETTQRRRDNSDYQAQLHLQLSHKSEPPLFVAIVTDITARKNLELQLVQAKKLESIGQLAAGIAHEINTPAQFVGDNTRFIKDAFGDLMKLSGNYRKLYNAVKDDCVTPELMDQVDSSIKSADVDYLAEEIPSAIDQSLDGITHISNIVRAMKEFSHPGGKNRESVNLNSAITSTITVASNEWKYLAEINTELADDLPFVPCYQQEINQVILNLIVNAAHAIESGQDKENAVKGTITIATRSLDDNVEITISDSGCGVPDEIKDRIFDPFFTTKEVGKGTGQGLAMAFKTVVDLHGGFLGVESTPGEGTTFTIRLPLQVNDPQIDEEAA